MLFTLKYAVLFLLLSCSPNAKRPIEETKNVNQSIARTKILFSQIQDCYTPNDLTSGRMNSLQLGPCHVSGSNFGFYNLIDQNSKLKPPVIANVIVSFGNLPWNYENEDQRIEAILVSDNLTKCPLFEFKVGDHIDAMTGFTKIGLSESTLYYHGTDCSIVIVTKNDKIDHFLFLPCKYSLEKLKETYPLVVDLFG